jgi:hypothetical protein
MQATLYDVGNAFLATESQMRERGRWRTYSDRS